ncbi:peroxiredoxin [Brevibacillus fulvus]|uniref:Alkyl hydroperoxide reductase subunit AhpC n=1 Tax=Brevibacillus fulvus TaxID=1125967 RepID=A0A938Y0F1_9BACL|nr:peroxiredoxin [Brevibacillus fulvus]MBM7588850.1 alkyl hydroperoxide reductase subunit AhpC [Brevibacillus fulvus]
MTKAAIGQPAPEFTMETITYDNGFPITKQLSDYRGKWLLLFFYPFDFSKVCPTEILSLNRRLEEFEKLNVEVLAVSTDSVHTHRAWLRSADGIGPLSFPLASDFDKEVAKSYGVLDDHTKAALRASFIIDPEGIIQYYVVSNAKVGRSVDETLRVIEAIQSGGLCPMDWKAGQKTLS